MDAGERRELVEALHDRPEQLVVAVTGGGVGLIADLLGVPGASRTVLEARVPYSEAALAGLIGGTPDQAVSANTAVAMAKQCRRRALALTGSGEEVLGVACTAALASDRPKRGEHRAHVAVASAGEAARWALTLAKGARSRAGEDRLVSDLVLLAVSQVLGLGIDAALDMLGDDVLEGPISSS